MTGVSGVLTNHYSPYTAL